MKTFAVTVNGASIGRYEARDACEALAKYLADRRRAEVRHMLNPTGQDCQATLTIGSETFAAVEVDLD